jgi:hypothetical protein
MANKLSQFSVGAVGNTPQIFSYSTSDNLATITQTNYIVPMLIQNALTVGEGDLFVCSYSKKTQGALLQVQIDGTQITLVEVAGTVTPGDGLVWSTVSGNIVDVQNNNAYIPLNGSLTIFNLPAICPIGFRFNIEGLGAGGWMIQANGGQYIRFLSTVSSAGGTCSSKLQYDNCAVVCVTANVEFKLITAGSAGLLFT